MFGIKGNYKIDGDNMFTSILDTLMHVGAIADDNQVMHGQFTKTEKQTDWHTTILISKWE
jgi:Holliday junction resolvase RusA-like endonuclease